MRKINLIIIHCSATPPSMDYSPKKMWNDHVNANGWESWGYHWYIRRTGEVIALRPEEEAGAHCKGFNNHSIGICYEGGVSDSPSFREIRLDDGTIRTVKYRAPEDNRTAEQKLAMHRLVQDIIGRYPITAIKGHRDLIRYGSKSCPCFDVNSEFHRYISEES